MIKPYTFDCWEAVYNQNYQEPDNQEVRRPVVFEGLQNEGTENSSIFEMSSEDQRRYMGALLLMESDFQHFGVNLL